MMGVRYAGRILSVVTAQLRAFPVLKGWFLNQAPPIAIPVSFYFLLAICDRYFDFNCSSLLSTIAARLGVYEVAYIEL